MRKTDQLRHQHAEISDIVKQLARHLDADSVVDSIPDIKSLMMNLKGKLQAHLAKSESDLYPIMISAPDAKVADTARVFQEEIKVLESAFNDYFEKWREITALEDDPDGFVDATEALTDVLIGRFQREESDLYPLADEL